MMNKFFKTLTIMTMTTTMMTSAVKWTKHSSTTVEWSMMKYKATNMSMMLTADVKSLSFSSCVMLITTAILLYSKFYMNPSKKFNMFNKMIMVFVMSMLLFIHSPNLISMVLGWEGLGMSSFILIMFYQNKKSMNSSFYTMMMNRMGDIMLMLSMTNFMNFNSWTTISPTLEKKEIMMLMMMTAAFSKSAQIPFSSWLTEAMAAPTPISALVHSSTLVTAGVFMIIRFEQSMKYSKMNTIIFMMSMMTLTMASLNSITEWDIKKTIALSTLSQLSMMFITISMNMFNLAMFHMMIHATFKALIFLCSSTFISFSNSQDMRKINKMSKNMFITKLGFNSASMTLCGFPFMSSFYSKEMIMEMMMIKKMNSMFVMMFYMCMACTLAYSFKMMMFINSMKTKTPLTPTKEVGEQKISKMMLMIPSTIYGNKMNWIMNMNFEVTVIKQTTKMLPNTMMIIMMVMMMNMAKKSMKMKSSKTKTMVSYMWFMKNFSINVKKIQLNTFFKTFKYSEKGMFTSMNKSMMNMVKMTSTKNFQLTHKNYKMINMMMVTAITMMI